MKITNATETVTAAWICAECAAISPDKEIPHGLSWQRGTCDVCEQSMWVTDARVFGEEVYARAVKVRRTQYPR